MRRLTHTHLSFPTQRKTPIPQKQAPWGMVLCPKPCFCFVLQALKKKNQFWAKTRRSHSRSATWGAQLLAEAQHHTKKHVYCNE